MTIDRLLVLSSSAYVRLRNKVVLFPEALVMEGWNERIFLMKFFLTFGV